MQTYNYQARNSKTGQKIKARVEADSEQAAAHLIFKQGLTPVDIRQERRTIVRARKVATKDRVMFSRQLSTLINAGLPLVQSLHNVAGQTSSRPLKAVIDQIITDVEAGQAFSVAVAKHPKVFNRVYISLVEASETSGTLDKGLERLADQQEKDAEIMSKVRGAMTYPAIVLLVMVAVGGFMVVKVLPQVSNIYNGIQGAKLPFITVWLMDLSHFITHDWYIAVAVIAAIAVGINIGRKTPTGRTVIDTVKMKMPPLGPLMMKMYMARFARTGSTLVASGVPLLHVLEITSEAVDNSLISKSINNAIEEVKGGKALSDSLNGDPNFLELVPNMLRIGEQSGAMEVMMSKVADYYEKEVDNQIKTISTIIEPVLMVIMGVFAIIIVAAILLPIYGLVNQSGFTS